MKKALVLFAHGARDPQWALPLERLQQIIATQQPGLTVRLAFLELMTPALPELLPELMAAGCGEVTVVPVFLGQGGHMRRDFPALIAQMRARHPDVVLRTAAAVGEDEGVLAAIAAYCLAACGPGALVGPGGDPL